MLPSTVTAEEFAKIDEAVETTAALSLSTIANDLKAQVDEDEQE